MAKNDLFIDIFGTNITISAEEPAEYLDMLLIKYRHTIENLQRTTGLKDPLKIAVLTGFLLCDDLEKAESASRAVKDEEQGEAERLTEGMILRLNEIITNATEPAAEPEGLGPKVRGSPPAEDVYAEETAESLPIYKLQNSVKNYDWGSAEWIPALLRQKNISRVPQAELWMGINPSAPSRIKLPGDSQLKGGGPLLSEVIDREKVALLGAETAGKFGTLPFLFKVLAAEKPLSIQAHPDLEQARNGFERENLNGIPPDAPERNYKDSSDKPEIICALSQFGALCGFRNAREICYLFEILSIESSGPLKVGFDKLISALRQQENPLKAFLQALFGMDSEWAEMLRPFLREKQELFGKNFPEYDDEWELCVYLTEFFPRDPGILAPLYLNIVELAPGEAMFVPAGILHSYIKGLGIELMTDSDNVLRGGLTSKHIDKAELLSVLNFSKFEPEVMTIPSPAPFRFKYPTPTENFSLSVMHGSGGTAAYTGAGPSILIVTSGRMTINQTITLDTGESAFIPSHKNLELSGAFTAYLASVNNI
jgi:mannose-6-phosphate isomerase